MINKAVSGTVLRIIKSFLQNPHNKPPYFLYIIIFYLLFQQLFSNHLHKKKRLDNRFLYGFAFNFNYFTNKVDIC